MEEHKDHLYCHKVEKVDEEEEDPNENEIINRLLNYNDAHIKGGAANDTSFKKTSY